MVKILISIYWDEKFTRFPFVVNWTIEQSLLWVLQFLCIGPWLGIWQIKNNWASLKIAQNSFLETDSQSMSRLGNDKFSPSVAFLTKIFIYCNLCLPVDMMTSSCQDWCTIFKLVPNIHEKETFIFLPDVLYHLCSNHPGIIKPHQYCHEIEIKLTIVITIVIIISINMSAFSSPSFDHNLVVGGTATGAQQQEDRSSPLTSLAIVIVIMIVIVIIIMIVITVNVPWLSSSPFLSKSKPTESNFSALQFVQLSWGQLKFYQLPAHNIQLFQPAMLRFFFKQSFYF